MLIIKFQHVKNKIKKDSRVIPIFRVGYMNPIQFSFTKGYLLHKLTTIIILSLVLIGAFVTNKR